MSKPSSTPMRVIGRLCETGRPATIVLEDGRIAAVKEGGEGSGDAAGASSRSLGGEHVWVAPGFIDLQLNGYGGDDFNHDFWTEERTDGGTTAVEAAESRTAGGKASGAGTAAADAIRRILDRAAAAGTALLCPTICTNGREAMAASLRDLARACDADPAIAAAIPAIHVEGPYISSEDGPRGAHPLEHTRDPDWDEFSAFQDAAEGRIRLLTLAPEREGALRFIEIAVESGVAVALGHTAASPERIQDAVKAGARMSTHLGNGAHAQIARHPNYIWEQLACDDLDASVIADGHHLPPSVLKCMARVKGAERLCLVSDAVALGGCPPGLYSEGRHEVLPSGKVVLAGTPYLAGAGHLLDTCFANALRFTDLGMAGAARAASANPARILGLDDRKGRIAPGCDADLTLFRLPPTDGPVEVLATIRGGHVVYSKRDQV